MNVQERTKDAQFIIISLRNNMFELADRLVGIYKTSDVTKSITINPKKIAAECAAAAASDAAEGREDVATMDAATASGKSATTAAASGSGAVVAVAGGRSAAARVLSEKPAAANRLK